MRALFTALPADSHVGPMLPLAKELVDRGWEISFAAAASMEDRIRSRGFGFFPVGMDWLEAEAEEAFPELASMSLDRQAYWWVTDLFADRVAKPAAADLLPVLKNWAPSVVVRDYWDFGAWAAAEAVEVPTAVVGLAMFTTPEEFAGFIGSQLQELRGHVGLGPDEELASLYAGLYVDLLPPSYQLNQPSGAVQMAPLSITTNGHSELGLTLPQPDFPTVLVTFGTVFNQVPGTFEMVLEALADEPLNVVVTTGHNRDPAGLAPLPPNTHAERFIPYDSLLPRCDAVICHAGLGTTMAALAHDLPLVALPLSADQFVHATRCDQLGIGRAIEQQHATPEAIQRAVTELLADRRTRQRVVRLGAEIRRMPGPQVAADAIEKAS